MKFGHSYARGSDFPTRLVLGHISKGNKPNANEILMVLQTFLKQLILLLVNVCPILYIKIF